MKQTLIGLMSAALWLVAAPLPAQTNEKEKEETLSVHSREKMQEHIAVLGVLLNRSLEKTYGFPLPVPGHHHGMGGGGGFGGFGGGGAVGYYGGMVGFSGGGGKGVRDAFHQLPAIEGVYLGGYGVVYSLGAPPPPRDPLARETPAQAKELSPWERTSRELRGEKTTQATSTSVPRPVSLSESLLRLLAENGKHFSQLPADERITVAITFRRNMDCALCHQPLGGGVSSTYSGGSRSSLLITRAQSQVITRAQSQEPVAQSAPYTPSPEVKNQLLLADLHMKQGRYAEAAKVYRDAGEKLLRTLAQPDRRTHADVQKYLLAGEVANRLAQALLAQGQQDEARAIMSSSQKIADAAVKLADRLKDKPARSGISLPAQLIVSAPKKLLDQAGGGKMSFEEFRKAATVEYVRFPTAKDSKKEDKKP